MTPDRVRAVQQRRQSNAAGPHGRRPTRADERAAAVSDWSDELAEFYRRSPAGDPPGAAEAN